MKKFLYVLTAGVFAAGCFALSACGDDENKSNALTLYAPDGAPALAIAGMMTEDLTVSGGGYSAEIECRVVDPSVISTKVKNNDSDKNADFCVLPLTAASKLLGSGEEYRMLGAVTHGNLYLVSKDGETLYAPENVGTLVGKTVGVLQINEVPGLVLKTALEKNGVLWQELKNDGNRDETKVNLVAISGPSDLGVIEADCYLLGEPAASAQSGKGYSIVGSLQEIYGGKDGYPQAVLVGKTSLTENGEWLAAFARSLSDSAEWLKSADGTEIVSRVTANLEDPNYATTLKAPLLSAEVLGRCGVRFEQAKDCRSAVETFLTAAAAVAPQMAVLPQTAFYYTGDLGI